MKQVTQSMMPTEYINVSKVYLEQINLGCTGIHFYCYYQKQNVQTSNVFRVAIFTIKPKKAA